MSRENGFGWDNEFAPFAVDVPAFRVDKYKVTNGQFLGFIRAGGYADRGLWSESDWRWKEENGIELPAFWKFSGGEYTYRGMFAEMPLPLDWPVYVSHAEASAYLAWAGKRLPAEAEWHRAADGIALAEYEGIAMTRWDPSPVNAFARGRSSCGAEGFMANGWEWTSSVFGPFAGFQAFPFYRGYSADFFDGKHYVMKGGSPRTAPCMLRLSFRNWFQAHYQFAYAGFRCAAND